MSQFSLLDTPNRISPARRTSLTCLAILFDMDGVLIDSTHAVARVWRRWAAEHDFNPDYVATIAQGRPSITTIRELLPEADHEAENRIIEQREIDDLEGVVALPGARELLGTLPAERWALVTSSTRPLAEVRLQAARLPVPKFFITSNDISLGKPHPEPFLKAAAMLGVGPHDCVVIEDTPAGIQAARAAGARVIALRTTMPEDVLRGAGADWIVNDCASIRAKSYEYSAEVSLFLDVH